MEAKNISALIKLVCSNCGEEYDIHHLHTLCTHCNAPLLARYDLQSIKQNINRETIASRPRGIWRWAELLPVKFPKNRVSLGEGETPILPSVHLALQLGLENFYIKDESRNPTGTFKDRGLSVSVSKNKELGAKTFVIPTAGNAGAALAAYAARANCEAHVFMPKDAPLSNRKEVLAYGAIATFVDGLITDAAKAANEQAKKFGWFNVSTFKEPYRVEGKKTMGYEIADAFNWELPDVIIYPTGGGTGIVGMWKAFSELEELGWIPRKRPRMVVVQSSGCAPIVEAFQHNRAQTSNWENAHTIASGLRVPTVLADKLILNILKESNGTAIAVSDEAIIQAQKELAIFEGLFVAPEGAATYAALKSLVDKDWVKSDEKIVLFNTGSGLKYI